MHSRLKRGLAAATAVIGLAIGALQIGDAGAITDWRNFGYSEAQVLGTEGHRSINHIRSTTNRNPERIRFVIRAPLAVQFNPGTVGWSLFCWNEFDGRQDSASGRFPLNDPYEARKLAGRPVEGGVDSYQFCNLRLDVRQPNQGTVQTFLQARYP